jgi:hypothetical protein
VPHAPAPIRAADKNLRKYSFFQVRKGLRYFAPESDRGSFSRLSYGPEAAVGRRVPVLSILPPFPPSAMSWLRRLERRLSPFAVRNLTMILIAGQALAFILTLLRPDTAQLMELDASRVLRGDWWRVVTFLFFPGLIDTPFGVVFFIISLLVLRLTGGAVEAELGAVRYNLFILIPYVGSVAVAVLGTLLFGESQFGNSAPNIYLYGTIFLTFAWLHPDFEFLMFFILPMKVKWLAWFTMAIYALAFLGSLAVFRLGGWLQCALIAVACGNVLLFFGREMFTLVRNRNVRMKRRFEELSQPKTARHVCVVCGATEQTNPERDFRYCPQCTGTPAYCNLHLKDHAHR